jgi:hypothetical protein
MPEATAHFVGNSFMARRCAHGTISTHDCEPSGVVLTAARAFRSVRSPSEASAERSPVQLLRTSAGFYVDGCVASSAFYRYCNRRTSKARSWRWFLPPEIIPRDSRCYPSCPLARIPCALHPDALASPRIAAIATPRLLPPTMNLTVMVESLWTTLLASLTLSASSSLVPSYAGLVNCSGP